MLHGVSALVSSSRELIKQSTTNFPIGKAEPCLHTGRAGEQYKNPGAWRVNLDEINPSQDENFEGMVLLGRRRTPV